MDARGTSGVLPDDADAAHLSRTRERCAELLPVLTADHIFSRRTAARLLDMPVPDPPGDRIDVASIGKRHAPRRPEIIGHQLREGVVRRYRMGELPVPSPADAWCLLSGVVSLDQLIAAGDALVTGRRRGRYRYQHGPYASIDDLREAVSRHRGGAGGKLRSAALEQIRTGVDSPAETGIRLIIVRAGLEEPEVDCSVPTAMRTYSSDLGYARYRIAVEHEGRYHFIGGEDQARRDLERREAMRAAGWHVLTTTSHDLRYPDAFLGRLAQALRDAGAGAD